MTRALKYDEMGRITEEAFECPQAETGYAPDPKKTSLSSYDTGSGKDPTFRRRVVFPGNYLAENTPQATSQKWVEIWGSRPRDLSVEMFMVRSLQAAPRYFLTHLILKGDLAVFW